MSLLWIYVTTTLLNIQLFQERLSEKMCTRQSRKVIRDMINTLFLTTVAVEPSFVASFSTRKHMSVASRAIISNFFEEQCPQNHSHYLSGLTRALFPTTFLKIAVCYHFIVTPLGNRIMFVLWFFIKGWVIIQGIYIVNISSSDLTNRN